MRKLRIGVLSPADIAKRRMIPALIRSKFCEYVGVAVARPDEREKVVTPKSEVSYEAGYKKALSIKEEFGGAVFDGFDKLINANDVDAVYTALPPYLHAVWGKNVLLSGKHLLMEKPFTVSYNDTEELIVFSEKSDLSVIENFGFIYHPQLTRIKEIIDSDGIGEIRLIRSNFAFPYRGKNDFRYKKDLGGGAVLDCGCYTIKLASFFLGENMTITDSFLRKQSEDDVDLAGTITAVSDSGVPAQLSFGMDQQYCCDLEIWGSKGCIQTPRVYTAPADYNVNLTLTRGMDVKRIKIDRADQFALVADTLAKSTKDPLLRASLRDEIRIQSRIIDGVLYSKGMF